MTRAPFVTAKHASPFERTTETYDTTMGWRFINQKLSDLYYPYTMIETADNVAEKYEITREEQDLFAYESQMKAEATKLSGRLKDGILPMELSEKGKTFTLDTDEHPRPDTKVEKLKSLRNINEKGTVTAGNASGINDCAAALLIMSETKAKELNRTPMAYVESFAVTGVDPAYMGLGPVSQKALKRAGISVEDLDLVELNEAFAAQALACLKELKLEKEKTNVNGGSIAYGHPAMCIGVGQGIATIVRRY